MTTNYYKAVAGLLKYLEDNNIELQSCGCCDGIKVNGEGGWCAGTDYAITVDNDEIKEWLEKHKEAINDK